MPKRRLKVLIGQCLGWFFIGLGVLGLILPVLHGTIFLLLGLLILSRTSPWAKRRLDVIEKRSPFISKQLDFLRNHPRLRHLFS